MAVLFVGGLLVWAILEAGSQYDKEYHKNRSQRAQD